MEKIKESEKEVNKLPSSNAEAIKLAEEYLDEQSKSHESLTGKALRKSAKRTGSGYQCE